MLVFFYSHFVYFTAKWYILWPFGTYILWSFGIFSPFCYVAPEKIWQPCFRREKNNYDPKLLISGALSRLPDWSCAETGSLGAATEVQVSILSVSISTKRSRKTFHPKPRIMSCNYGLRSWVLSDSKIHILNNYHTHVFRFYP
jgi:hypothetical protein